MLHSEEATNDTINLTRMKVDLLTLLSRMSHNTEF